MDLVRNVTEGPGGGENSSVEGAPRPLQGVLVSPCCPLAPHVHSQDKGRKTSVLCWLPARGPFELKDREIHIWRVDLNRGALATDALQTILAPEELGKARLFRFECDRNSFIVARGALRTIL